MEQTLRRNDWKGGWHHEDTREVLLYLVEEVGELIAACRTQDGAAAQQEAVDIANFSMMIFDLVGG